MSAELPALLPYDIPPDPAVVSVTPGGMYVARRQHPQTGQLLIVIGSHHPPYDPTRLEYRDVEKEWAAFSSMTEGGVAEVLNEGRTPQLRLSGAAYAGERPPWVDAENRDEVIRVHGDMGLVARLGVLGARPVLSGEVPDADRVIALQMETLGHSRQNIMRYLLLRQMPQWLEAVVREVPDLATYLQTEVVGRYRRALEADWPDFEFSLSSIIGVRNDILEWALRQMETREVGYFLTETVGVMCGKADPGRLTPVQRVSKDYNLVRTAHFARRALEGWGRQPVKHRFMLVGKSHLRAMTGCLATSRSR